MKNEAKLWFEYANENLLSAEILLKSHLYNPSLQNSQQAIEKFLKACFVENNIKLQKMHTIAFLAEELKKNHIDLSITEDDIDLIDSIYLTSKYPFGSVLPDFEPDKTICQKCLDVANAVKEDIIFCIRKT